MTTKYLVAAGVLFVFYMFCKAVGGGESVCYVDSPDAAMCSSDKRNDYEPIQ